MTQTSLDDMQLFAAVVEAEGYSQAARVLGLSKSSVSKRISALEDRLGVRLLNRTTRRLSLTEAGAAFHEGCLRVVAAAEAAEEAVTHLASAPRGILRISAPMSFGVQHVAPFLPALLERYPELAIDLVLNDRIVDLVDEGFDLAIRIGNLSDSSLIARRLAPSRRMACASPAYLDAQGTPQTPAELRHHDCLLYSYQASGATWRFRGPAGPQHVSVSGRLQANNGEALRAAAIGGLGIALLPTFLVCDQLRDGRLVALLREWQDPGEGGVHALFPTTRNLSPKVRAAVEFFAECFGGTPYWDRGLS